MAFDYRSVVVALKANVKAWVAGMAEAGASVTTLKGVAEDFAAGDYDPKIGIDDTKARADLSSLQKELDRLGVESTKVNISLVDAEAKARLEALTERLRQVGTKVTDAKVDVNDTEGRAKLAGFEADLLHMAAKTAEPTIDLAGIAKAEAQLGILEGRLEAFSHKRYEASVAVTGTERAARQTSFLIDAIATLGPAAVASSAVAVGAFGAFGASMASAGVAGGVLGIAVAGTVSQMKKQEQAIVAAQKALAGQTKGTQAYRDALAKVNQLQREFDTQFGPAADAFGKFQTTWHTFLADTAGTSDTVIAKALNLASLILPKLEGIVEAAGGSVEKLLDGVREFAQGPEAAAMLAFFETHGPVAIEAFGSAIGNIGKGFVSLLMAFAPMQDGILGGLQSLTKGFADWASQVGQTQGFQNFLAYIADTGPKVLDALGAISGALLAVLKAAAPIGTITLPILTELANMLALIANSPAGPALVGLALALSTVNRALVTMKAIQASQIGLAIAQIGTQAGTAGGKMLAARAGFVAAGIGLEILASHLDGAHQELKDFTTVAGATAIGLGVGGPWGAAIGGAAGLLQVFTQHSQSAAEAQKALDTFGQQVADTLNKETGAITQSTIALVQHDLAAKGAYAAANTLGLSLDTVTRAAIGDKDALALITTAYQNHKAALFDVTGGNQKAAASFGDAATATAQFGGASSATSNDLKLYGDAVKLITDLTGASSGAIDRTTASIAAQRRAADEANLAAHPFIASVSELDKVFGQLGPSIDGAAAAERRAADLSSIFQTETEKEIALLAAAKTSVDNYKAALDGLINTDGDVFDAQRAITTGYLDMAKAVKGTSRSLDDQTTKGNTNIDMFKGQIDNIKHYLVAQKEAGKSPEFLTRALQNQRQELIRNAVQLGFNRNDVEGLLRTYGLTPKLIATLMKVEGTDLASRIAKDLQTRLDNLGKPHQIPISADAAAALAGEKEVQDGADKIDNSTPVVHISADAADANNDITNVRTRLADLDGDTATTYINTVVTQTQITKVLTQLGRRYGGTITGPGTKTSDSIPLWGSVGEFMHQAAAVDKYGLGLMHAINNLSLPLEFVRAAGYAGGGSIGGSPVTESMTRAQPVSLSLAFPGFAKEIANLRAEIHELRTGTQKVHTVNAHEMATGVRSVADDSVAQDRAHRQDLQDMWATG